MARTKLDALVRIRSIEEEDAKGEFIAALRGMHEEERALTEIRALREEVKQMIRTTEHGELTLDHVIGRRRYLNVLARIERIRRERFEERRAIAEMKRAAHERARNRRRAVVELRDRRMEALRIVAMRREGRELDEIGLRAFALSIGAEEQQ